MVKDNLYGRGVPLPDYLFGMHTAAYAVGYIENSPGFRMAGSTGVEVTFHGIGGHGSMPYLAKDPVIMAANAILDYQAVVMRSVSPLNPHVITVGSVDAGTVANVIPDKATLKITTRWYEAKDRETMIKGINKVDSGIALMNNLPPDLYPDSRITSSVYPVKNDTGMVAKLNAAFDNKLPLVKRLLDRPVGMGSEDFPLLIINSKKNPVYDFMFVGIGNKEACTRYSKDGVFYPYNNHNPNFAVDLSAIPLGTVIGSTALLELFTK
jgi:hippurate hydrolase